MLLDEEEFRIMSHAVEPHLRDPKRSEGLSRRIFHDFFLNRQITGTKFLELGPGQYDFAQRMQSAGTTVVAIDLDPAVIALGRKRGYQVIHSDFRDVDWASLGGQFDGLFCRASINPFLFDSVEPLVDFVLNMCSVLKPNGWGWLAPFNSVINKKALPSDVESRLDAQRLAFERCGFTSFEYPSMIAERYAPRKERPVGVEPGSWEYTVRPVVFLKNIDPPQR